MKKIRTLIALTIVAFIPFGLMTWMRIHQSTGFASKELILFPLLFGGGSIVILYLLKKYFLKEKVKDFNSGEGGIVKDLLWGLILTAAYFLLFYLDRVTIANWLPFRANQELLNLMLDMRKNPLLLFIWFGPVLWIGVALYEELVRVFVLDGLWKFNKGVVWSIVVIVISAALMGIAHWSQGPYGIVSIGIKSLVSGFYYYKRRRLFPLIFAHVLYDGIQVAMLLITYPQ